MFSELLESVAAKKQTRKGWAVVASAILQSLCLMLTFLIPLIYTQALPKTRVNAFLLAPVPSPRPAAPPQDTAPRVRQPARLFENNILREPTSIPTNVAMIQEPPLPPDASTDSQADGSNNIDLLENITASPARPTAPAPPPTPPSPAAIASQRI
jgi:protein TonB